MTTTFIAIRVDKENNAETFWAALRATYPVLARSLERNGAAVIESSLWRALAALPGFDDGPEYGATALIDCGSEGDQFGDVTAGAHQVFEVIS